MIPAARRSLDEVLLIIISSQVALFLPRLRLVRLDNDERATELDVGAKPVWGSSVLTDPRLHACMQSAGRRSKGVAHLEGRQTQITNSTAAAAIAVVCGT